MTRQNLNNCIQGIIVSLSLLMLLLVYSREGKRLYKNEKYRSRVTSMFERQKQLAKSREEQLFGIFKSKLSYEERDALEFLYAFMPLSDLADYDGSFYLGQVRATLKTRKGMPWVKNLPEDVFLHFVLPVRVNNENLDSFRIIMYDELRNRVKGLSMKNAALEINHWCHEKVNYRGSDARTSSPFSTMKTSWGRCGEESVFTVEALRTVGIPARQVYTPRWAHTDDNHAWVEVWVDGKWSFLGACEPDVDLNMSWFAEPSRRAMLVHTRAYGCYYGSEPVIDTNARFSELNLIGNYAPSKTLVVRVSDQSDKPVKDAKVEYRLYNYSEFYPIARNFTNEKGFTSIISGLGDLLIWASKENKYGYMKISMEKTDTLSIQLTADHPKDYHLDYDLVPPVQPESREMSEQGRSENQHRLMLEDSIRLKYSDTFRDSAWASQLAGILKLNADSVRTIFTKTCGNWKEIEAFLEQNDQKNKSWTLGFLNSLSDKDLRDSKAATLNDHFRNGFTYNNEPAKSDPALFTNYVLSPRIEMELIRSWRSYLQGKFDSKFTLKAQKDITAIVEWIQKNIRIDDDANLLSRCPVSPVGVFELKVSDTRSRNIFFVALCRSLGIPARINPVNGMPQNYSEKSWNDVWFDKKQLKGAGKGYIHFIGVTPDMEPRYYINFTIARFNNGVPLTLEFDENKPLGQFPAKVEVDAGDYMLVTGYRLTGGPVLSGLTFFEVKDHELKNIPVKIRTPQTKTEIIGTIKTDNYSLSDFTGKPFTLNTLVKNKGAILIWLDPDKEPSRHVMVDIPLFKEKFDKWGGSIAFLLLRKNANKSFNPSNYKNLPSKSQFIFDNDNRIISMIGAMKKRNLQGNFPVVVACDSKGKIIFFSEGYTIGIGDQLVSITRFLN